MKSIIQLILLLCLTVNANHAFAETRKALTHCNSGVRYDCSDCNANSKTNVVNTFKIAKYTESVMIKQSTDGTKSKAFIVNKCMIVDDKNWLCYLPLNDPNDMYEETITHKMERGYYEFKASSPQGTARYCGTPIEN